MYTSSSHSTVISLTQSQYLTPPPGMYMSQNNMQLSYFHEPLLGHAYSFATAKSKESNWKKTLVRIKELASPSMVKKHMVCYVFKHSCRSFAFILAS